MSDFTVLILDDADQIISTTPFVHRADAFEYANYMLDQQVGRVQVLSQDEIIDREVWLQGA